MSLEELLLEAPDSSQMLMKQKLGYVQSNGTISLRRKIADLYSGATPDHILVTNGTSEANYLVTWNLTEPDDEVLLMLPNYMQIWGISRAFRGTIRPFHLREETGWRVDFDELERAVSPRTRLIAVCNPNNPTGAILSEEEMQRIVEVARNANAWLLADEVYQGAERDGKLTGSFWGRYEKTIITAGLSKAYGLPGLRIGWIAGEPDLIAKLWSYHDYLTIGPGMLSDVLAQIALTPSVRGNILGRTRKILQTNYPVLAEWIRNHGDLFSLVEPKAGAIAYVRYNLPVNSTQLVEKLLHEKSVLIVPGDHFGMDHYLRIGYGEPANFLHAALDRIHDTLASLKTQNP